MDARSITSIFTLSDMNNGNVAGGSSSLESVDACATNQRQCYVYKHTGTNEEDHELINIVTYRG